MFLFFTSTSLLSGSCHCGQSCHVTAQIMPTDTI